MFVYFLFQKAWREWKEEKRLRDAMREAGHEYIEDPAISHPKVSNFQEESIMIILLKE